MSSEVPPGERLSVDDRIDERCDAFESAWRTGQRPSLVDYIRPEDESHRKMLFCELLLVDIECRRALGEQPTEDQYLSEFPEFADQVHTTRFRYGSSFFSAPGSNGASLMHGSPKQPGTSIAHFQLVERLGAGAMGEAWKAWDARLKRHVTIKLPHGGALTESDMRRFLREGEAAAQLSHPQLASVHEVNNDGETFYIVAAFVEGKNLKEYAAERQLAFAEIAGLCASIGEALQRAHDQDVIHRDLKPANIIVDPKGIPHIIDFGLAKIRDADHDLTLNGELLGTPAYMPPELASGNSDQADARTDVYSLGVILFELLARRCPFEGNRGSVIGKIIACEPPKPRALRSSVPRDLETICLKAIAKSPGDRYKTARDLAEDLRRYIARKPIRARRTGIVERSWRWTYRHPAIAAAAFLAMAGIVAAGGKINSLHKSNKQLAGIRPVLITTTPPGAQVAIVPIDPATNEPRGAPAVSGATPLTTDLSSGTYLVEAVLPGTDPPLFVEVYRTVSDQSDVPDAMSRRNEELGLDRNLCHFREIVILPQHDVIEQMVEVTMSAEDRAQNPLLPEKLYVDAQQTTPLKLKQIEKFKGFVSENEGEEPCIKYASAVRWAEVNQTRLPSAAEYDAIVAAVKRGDAHFVGLGKATELADLVDSYPEWSTTTQGDAKIGGNGLKRHFHGMHILKGFTKSNDVGHGLSWVNDELLEDPEKEVPKISIRGVRSATPRFVKF